MKNQHNITIGKLGEDTAAEYLQKQGYDILSRNFRTKYGEIDIVSQKDGIIYCVEVKTRLSNRYGSPIDAITPQKLQKMQLMGGILISYLKTKRPVVLSVCEVTKDKCNLIEI